MTIKFSRTCSAVLLAALLMTAVSCGEKEPSYEDRETFEKETYIVVEGRDLTFRDGLVNTAYADDSAIGQWLTGCASPNRDERFDAYTLRHESNADGNTVFTYLIYYPHGMSGYVAVPELLERESGYVINLRYKPGAGTADYSLSYLTVTLPTEDAPRLRLLLDEEPLGVMSTVTDEVILPGQ